MLAKRGSREISVDGVTYRWTAKKKRTTLLVAIQHLEANGQMLSAEVSDDIYDQGWVERFQGTVTPSMVKNIIRRGIEKGWESTRSGPVFNLSCFDESLLPIPMVSHITKG